MMVHPTSVTLVTMVTNPLQYMMRKLLMIVNPRPPIVHLLSCTYLCERAAFSNPGLNLQVITMLLTMWSSLVKACQWCPSVHKTWCQLGQIGQGLLMVSLRTRGPLQGSRHRNMAIIGYMDVLRSRFAACFEGNFLQEQHHHLPVF